MTEIRHPLCIAPEKISNSQRKSPSRKVFGAIKTCHERDRLGDVQFHCTLDALTTATDYSEVCPIIKHLGAEAVMKAVATQRDREK